jgi:hypothetical protein
MAQLVRNVPDGGLDEPPGWEAVTPAVDPLPVPGGWIYRTDPGGVVFVPDKDREVSSRLDTGAVG